MFAPNFGDPKVAYTNNELLGDHSTRDTLGYQ